MASWRMNRILWHEEPSFQPELLVKWLQYCLNRINLCKLIFTKFMRIGTDADIIGYLMDRFSSEVIGLYKKYSSSRRWLLKFSESWIHIFLFASSIQNDTSISFFLYFCFIVFYHSLLSYNIITIAWGLWPTSKKSRLWDAQEGSIYFGSYYILQGCLTWRPYSMLDCGML